ncbi:mrdA [Wigglesworthia glossinidia endosymbiont of Glossina brevipalpis]|uniref:Peptidoglycan D,D-transpeptidase MrdA n=1 Tax=Wigglesworthia glossinidia brevipalpis TaxID=36870 RepID=Q8D329_WIGBR|nr:mrdA [Wigglesworthia glossinidia endosymbiont of Glossina brevipalpis]
MILISNLYYLQIFCFSMYQTKSNDNRIKIISIPPSRGTISDRNGNLLALNRTIYQLEINLKQVENIEKTIKELKSVVDLNQSDIFYFEKERKKYNYLNKFLIKSNLTDIQHARFSINQYRFPGVHVKNYQTRYYPYGEDIAHVIGYVSQISNKDMICLSYNKDLLNYYKTKSVGKIGIEKFYEKKLHGQPGFKEVEVNSKGKIIRQLRFFPPQPGKNIILTLDLNIQKYIKNLISSIRAAVVVIDPRDGGILALVSNPSYDPNIFVNGISNKKYLELLTNLDRPFINRTTQGTYPPASTIKPYILISALHSGIINTNFFLFDPGWWKLPGSEKKYRDWKKWGHGYLNITKAIEESSDTFFYQIAYNMGIDRLSEWMKKFGYGTYTGIDISEESIGVMPNRDWKLKYIKDPWYQGDTISVGIGQGYWTATPIQISKSLMTLINNGLVKNPHLLYGILEKDNKFIPYFQSKYLQIGDPRSNFWEIVKNGMYGVANHSNGTAYKNFYDAKYKIAAKSGTAQLFSLQPNEIYDPKKLSTQFKDHKLMTAFAPFNNPTVCIVVILENGGDYLSAGEISRKILDYILLKKS